MLNPGILQLLEPVDTFYLDNIDKTFSNYGKRRNSEVTRKNCIVLTVHRFNKSKFYPSNPYNSTKLYQSYFIILKMKY